LLNMLFPHREMTSRERETHSNDSSKGDERDERRKRRAA
jgi:hypothetical protein